MVGKTGLEVGKVCIDLLFATLAVGLLWIRVSWVEVASCYA
jgi:hypothetical protein